MSTFYDSSGYWEKKLEGDREEAGKPVRRPLPLIQPDTGVGLMAGAVSQERSKDPDCLEVESTCLQIDWVWREDALNSGFRIKSRMLPLLNWE